MVLQELLKIAPHVAEKVYDKLDGASVRNLLWVSSDVRSFTVNYMQTRKGKDKEKSHAIEKSVNPAIIAFPGTKETYYGENPLGGGIWDHSMSQKFHDRPPTMEQILPMLSGSMEVEAYDPVTFALKDGEKTLTCEEQVLARGGTGYFGHTIEEFGEACKIHVFKTNDERDHVLWKMLACEDAPLYGSKKVSTCFSKSGSFVVAISIKGSASLLSFADGRLLAKGPEISVSKLADLTLGAEDGRIVVAENAPDFCMLQTFGDRNLEFQDFGVLRTGASATEFVANVEIFAGYAVVHLQDLKSMQVFAYATRDVSPLDSISMSDWNFFPNRRYVASVTDEPGCFISEKILPDWRLNSGEYCGPSGGDAVTPAEKEKLCTTRLYLTCYPRTLHLLWWLQSCQAEIVCKKPKGFKIEPQDL